jgi:F-type H+-transporting ATPase subunit gamma
MPSLKSLKVRIKSVRSTQKITKAMKMVAASKLKHAREKAEAAAPYADKMANIVLSLASNSQQPTVGQTSLLTGTGKDNTHLIVIVTSDRGLCGAFNSSILKASRRKIEALLAKGKEVKIICLGKKGYDLLKTQYGSKIIMHKDGIGKKGVKFAEAQEIGEKILELFETKQFDVCSVIFNKFKSVISQVVTDQQIIPLEIPAEKTESVPYEYEPEEEEILTRLLPKNIAVQAYRALLESSASEHGARMSAMDSATRNSGDMIKKLNLLYNRTRQAYITRELIEIISGAEAV